MIDGTWQYKSLRKIKCYEILIYMMINSKRISNIWIHLMENTLDMMIKKKINVDQQCERRMRGIQ